MGSGQLGRMLAMAAQSMGYQVHVFSPEAGSPAGQVCGRETVADYQDLQAIQQFARSVDVVTLEFENIPVSALEAIEGLVPVHPGREVLHIAQNRLREKRFLSSNGFPLPPFYPVRSAGDLQEGLERIGCPAVLKTAGFGYDGKGQSKISSPEEAERAWDRLDRQEAVLEQFVRFEKELSVIAARSMDGSSAHYGVIENRHRDHILDISLAPADVPLSVSEQAVAITRRLMESLSMMGLLCVEFFLAEEGQLLINEIAPRPHNSGHWTMEASVTSQFEQLIRAICGLPLGSTRLLSPAAMGNLLGDLWKAGPPDWSIPCSFPQVKLHLYGKREPRSGRKMGHLTALADSHQEALERVLQARSALGVQQEKVAGKR